MNTRKRIVVIITALCTLLAITGCAYFSQLIGSGSSLPTGSFNCSIPVSIQGNKDIVILSFTITPEQKIGNWSIFDFGTRSISIGDGIGQSSLNGNAIQFTLTTSSAGMNITYKINGTIVPPHEMTGSYSFDYGSSYGVVADKFDCDLTPPAAQSTPATSVPLTKTPPPAATSAPTVPANTATLAPALTKWNGIPIMPGAIGGREEMGDYQFTTAASENDIVNYYEQELPKSGWVIQTDMMTRFPGTTPAFKKGNTFVFFKINAQGSNNVVLIHLVQQ